MKEQTFYNHKKLKKEKNLNVSDETVIPAFDAVVNLWLKQIKEQYSTYEDVTGALYISVNNRIVRISFKRINMDRIDHDEAIMMLTDVFMYSDEKAPLNILMDGLEKFIYPCTEDELKQRAKARMHKKSIKTYHMSRSIKEYYGLVS